MQFRIETIKDITKMLFRWPETTVSNATDRAALEDWLAARGIGLLLSVDPEDYGNGLGYGFGDGFGYGNGYGDGDGFGHGDGDGSGYGDGNELGYG